VVVSADLQQAAASPRQPIDFVLSAAAAPRMVSDIQTTPGLELGWALGVDRVLGELKEPRLLRRGTPEEIRDPYAEMHWGEVFLHSHPDGTLRPSVADLDSAEVGYRLGIAFGVVVYSLGALELLLVTPPRRPTLYAPSWSRLFGRYCVTVTRLPPRGGAR
jgi:hypothetical protein